MRSKLKLWLTFILVLAFLICGIPAYAKTIDQGAHASSPQHTRSVLLEAGYLEDTIAVMSVESKQKIFEIGRASCRERV